MTLLHAIIFGVVEGVTEFLPISSTGHLILTARLLKVLQTDFLKSFELAIQLGAILSVVVLYWRQLAADFNIVKRIAAAFIPTAAAGLLFYKIMKRFLLGNELVVLCALFLGGVFLIVFELLHREREGAAEGISNITYPGCLLIGLFQSVSIVPGVSRAAATICGGLLLGIRRRTIVEFSFLLAVPTMLAAAGFDLIKSGPSFSSAQYIFLLTGFLTSFVVALASIKFLLNFIKGHNFIPFGVYRVILALAFWIIR